MQPPPIPPSPPSSTSWSNLDIELQGSARLAWAWASWCAALALGAALGSSLPSAVRLILVLLAAALGRQGVVALRSRRSCDIRRLRWQADGRWWLQERGGRGAYVQTQPPQRLGTLLWIRWRSAGRRRLLIIDGAVVEPNDWRRLKARLKFGRT
jgi:hypothetical protein